MEYSETVVNYEEFCMFAGRDEEEAKQMIDLFVEQSAAYIEELKTALRPDAEQEWHDVAHKIKGMAGFAGAHALRDHSHVAQKGWQSSMDEKVVMLETIERERKRVLEFFENL